ASTFRTRAALQAEILALRHQLAVLQKNAPRRLRLHRCDRLLWLCCTDAGPVGDDVSRWFSPTRSSVGTAKFSPGIGPGNRAAIPAGQKLRRTLHNYFAYYQWSRTHLALGKDAPESRAVEPPEQGRVVAIPQAGGFHHRYQRRAA